MRRLAGRALFARSVTSSVVVGLALCTGASAQDAKGSPAHIKAALTGSALTIPIADGRLALGTWQGIYLCEHRDHGGSRSVVVTAFGE